MFGIKIPHMYHKKLQSIFDIKATKKYLKQMLIKEIENINNDRPAFVSRIFFTVSGLNLLCQFLDEKISRKIISYIMNLKKNGGFIATRQDYVSWREGMLPDFSSTFFSVCLLYILNYKLKKEDYLKIVRWIIKQQDQSGAFIHKKCQSAQKPENTFWAILTIKIIEKNLNIKLKHNLLTAADFLIKNIEKYNYITQRFFALRSLQILRKPISVKVLDSLVNFVNIHWNKTEGGYHEFLFKYVKRDRYTRHRTTGDTNLVYIHSTFYALLIKLFTNQRITEVQKEKILNFIKSNQNKDGGFGVQIKIRTYSLGPSSTPSETLFALLIPAVLENIKNY